jgi:hypothetical protein
MQICSISPTDAGMMQRARSAPPRLPPPPRRAATGGAGGSGSFSSSESGGLPKGDGEGMEAMGDCGGGMERREAVSS